jgi:predicted enzyme related to lactoylglutathione lyase
MGTPFRLGHIALYARNRERVSAYYRHWFGEDASGGVDVVGHPNEVKMTYFADSSDDVERLRRNMTEAGLPVGAIEDDGAFVGFRCNDPEGNRIVVLWARGVLENTRGENDG